MENSIKAVYMAAGVLIGVLILTTFIFVFRKGGQVLENVDNRKSSEAIAEYNSKLIIYNRKSYEEDGEIHYYYNTIFDIVTACNLAYEINNQNEFDNRNYLIIEFRAPDVRAPDRSNTYILENKKEQKKGYIADKLLTDLIKDYGKRIDIDPRPDVYKWDYEYKFTGKTVYDDSTGKINKIIFEKESI